MGTTPHALLTVFTPGEIAECIEQEIGEELYEKLWSLHPEYAAIPRDNFAACAATNWWDRFSAAEHDALNAGLARLEERCRKLAS